MDDEDDGEGRDKPTKSVFDSWRTVPRYRFHQEGLQELQVPRPTRKSQAFDSAARCGALRTRRQGCVARMENGGGSSGGENGSGLESGEKDSDEQDEYAEGGHGRTTDSSFLKSNTSTSTSTALKTLLPEKKKALVAYKRMDRDLEREIVGVSPDRERGDYPEKVKKGYKSDTSPRSRFLGQDWNNSTSDENPSEAGSGSGTEGGGAPAPARGRSRGGAGSMGLGGGLGGAAGGAPALPQGLPAGLPMGGRGRKRSVDFGGTETVNFKA